MHWTTKSFGVGMALYSQPNPQAASTEHERGRQQKAEPLALAVAQVQALRLGNSKFVPNCHRKGIARLGNS